MPHDQTALYYTDSVLTLLLRTGVVTPEAVLEMADEQEQAAIRLPDEADARRDAAHQLRCALLSIQTPSEARADGVAAARREIVERTREIAARHERDA